LGSSRGDFMLPLKYVSAHEPGNCRRFLAGSLHSGGSRIRT
jgi:hypothetical protein